MVAFREILQAIFKVRTVTTRVYILLGSDCQHKREHLVVLHFFKAVDVILAGIKLVANQVRQQCLVVNRALWSDTRAHGGVKHRCVLARGQFKYLQPSFTRQPAETAETQIDDPFKVYIQYRLDFSFTRYDFFPHRGDRLDPYTLVIITQRVKNKAKPQRHSTRTAGQQQAFIVKTCWLAQAQGLIFSSGLLCQLAFRKPGNAHHMEIIANLFRELNGLQAFRGVPAPKQQNQDRRGIGFQKVIR